MDNHEKEALIKEKYGYAVLESGPVDPDNPTFASLLGAMKEVYEGKCGMDVLVKYHEGLSKQIENSREFLKKTDKETPEEYKALVEEQHRISLGALDIVQGTLDLIDSYIKNPSKELMATCVESLLNSQRIMKGVHDMLDENINRAEEEQ
ncbi:MAG: hypothetical protein ABRQ38_18580 [Candidatus Eremiobacterota bacterium]